MNVEFTFEFDGRSATVSCTVNAPEEDVGIMGPWVECVDAVYDDTGEKVPEALVERNEEKISTIAAQRWYDQELDDYE